MSDIWLAIIVMSFLSMASAGLSAYYPYTERGQVMLLLLALSIFATITFKVYLAGELFWARIVPSSAAIIYTNLAAIFASFGVGWGWRLPNAPTWRRASVATVLGVISVAAILWPLLSMALRPPPAGQNEWKGPVAMQTSWATCSPAAAATLLRAEGIDVSEREMLPLCLTDYLQHLGFIEAQN